VRDSKHQQFVVILYDCNGVKIVELESDYRPDIVVTVELDVATPVTFTTNNCSLLASVGHTSLVFDHLSRPAFPADHILNSLLYCVSKLIENSI